MPALPDPPELLGGGTFSRRPAPPLWVFFGADCASVRRPPPGAVLFLFPAGVEAEVADGAEAVDVADVADAADAAELFSLPAVSALLPAAGAEAAEDRSCTGSCASGDRG